MKVQVREKAIQRPKNQRRASTGVRSRVARLRSIVAHRELLHVSIAGFLIFWATFWLYRRLFTWPDTPDGLFHLHRVRALVEAWQQGVFYPRWFPDFAFGYGHPILNFYSPGYYPVAGLFHWLGFDLLTANQIALALFFGLSGVAMYLLLRRLAGHWPALAGTALFLFFPYRLYDLFVRGALPEFAAFLWPPLLVYGYLRVFQSAPLPSIGRAHGPHIFTGLMWAGLILTHNLTALMAGLVWFGIAGVLLVARAWASRGRIDASPNLQAAGLWAWHLTVPLALGGILSGFYVVPVILEARWVDIGVGTEWSGYLNHIVDWPGLWQWYGLYTYPDAGAPTVGLPLYVAILCIAALPAALGSRLFSRWLSPQSKGSDRPSMIGLWVTLACTLIAIWLTTSASVWFWELLGPLLNRLQFPWRWQTVIGFGTAILLAQTLHIFAFYSSKNRYPVFQAVTAGVLIVFCVVYAGARLPRVGLNVPAQQLDREQMWEFDRAHGQVGATWTGEFLPRWVSAPRWTIGREPADPPPADTPPSAADLDAVIRPLYMGYLGAGYAVQSSTPFTLTLSHFYYPARHAQVNERNAPLEPVGELGWMAAPLESGEHILSVQWQATTAVWLGRLATLAGWLWVMFMLWQMQISLRTQNNAHGKLSQYRPAMAAWLIAGAAGMIAATNPAAGHSTNLRAPGPLHYDFGPVYLSAAEIPGPHPPTARNGIPFEMVLHWTIQTDPTAQTDGASLQAFVHVADAHGTTVAQYDTPIGGHYLPIQRFLPGMPLTSRHRLTLPDDAPPGRYTVYAGVYIAGQPHLPLLGRATGAETGNPRPAIGALEITGTTITGSTLSGPLNNEQP